MDESRASDRVSTGSAYFPDHDRSRETETRLIHEVPHRWLAPLRAAWIAIAVLAVALFVVGFPAYYGQLETVCTGDACADQQLTPDGARTLPGLGFSVGFYAAYVTTVTVVFAAA